MSVPASGGYQGIGPQVNFDWISQAWRLFQAQAGAWIGAMLLFLLVALALDVPLAFITGYSTQFTDAINAMKGQAPPTPANPFVSYGHSLLFSLFAAVIQSVLVGGLYRMAIRQGRGEAIKATDIFSAFDSALPLAVVGIITQVLANVGILLCVIPGFIVVGLLMFAPLLVVDRRLGPLQAISGSIGLLKGQFLMATLFFFVVSLLAGLGALVCGVGLVATYPLLAISVALGYLAFTQPFSPPSGPAAFGTPEPGVWPPPPTA